MTKVVSHQSMLFAIVLGYQTTAKRFPIDKNLFRIKQNN